MKLETVKVVGGESYYLINKADFDPKKHKLFEEKPKPKPRGRPPKRGE